MTRFEFEFACKMRVIWLKPLLLCAVSGLDINFDRAPPTPHSSAPVRQERGCFLTVLPDVPPHFSTLLLALSTRSIHFLFLPRKLCGK